MRNHFHLTIGILCFNTCCRTNRNLFGKLIKATNKRNILTSAREKNDMINRIGQKSKRKTFCHEWNVNTSTLSTFIGRIELNKLANKTIQTKPFNQAADLNSILNIHWCEVISFHQMSLFSKELTKSSKVNNPTKIPGNCVSRDAINEESSLFHFIQESQFSLIFNR